MKALILPLILAAMAASPDTKENWSLCKEGNGIVLDPVTATLPYSDHIEMSGEQMAFVLRWGVSEDRSFTSERSLVFPMLRTIPNNTHASLMQRVATDIPSLLSVGGRCLTGETVRRVKLDGYMEVESVFKAGSSEVGLERKIFPSTDKPLMGEIYTLKNLSTRALTVIVPEYSQVLTTPKEKGVTGSYIVRADILGSVTTVLQPGDSIGFGACFQAYREGDKALRPDLEAELAARKAYLDLIDSNLILDTPDDVIDREFRFAKIRASESIFKTAGGYMHGPGGESYYAALWANDQAEYVNPFFPFLGYSIGNESALNSYNHFARFMNPEYKPIPSSIIAEGIDIWNGAGDRGDAAMIAHGASRYALERGDRDEAERLWPLIEWCLEYCRLKLNDDGVVLSDSDELEGRFPSGDANLCTSTLYYDGLRSAAMLAKSLGKGSKLAAAYNRQADNLAVAIEEYFGADVQGYHTYRYYDGNDVLRSWICMPLIVGILNRAEGTIAALTSDKLMTPDGLLTQQGSSTFWDRSTLYSLRGIYIAGETATANAFLRHYSSRRLLGDHVPYPIEAWPEGSQRHLSAESGLYCRAIIEGMFGLRPTGLRSFKLTPRLAAEWDKMSLKHVRAFGGDFCLHVSRLPGNKLEIRLEDNEAGTAKTWKVADGSTIEIKLGK